MSLIELLTAVAVASIMFMAMMEIIFSATKSLNVLKKRMEMTQQARLVLERMTREIASAFHPYGMYAETSARTPKPWLIVKTNGTLGEKISFTPNLNQLNEFEPSPPNADITEIEYHVVESASSKDLYRRQEEDPLATIASTTEWAGGADVKIAQYVEKLDFKVWDKAGSAAADPYDPGYTGSELGFPSRVRIAVTFYDPDNVVSPQTFAVDVSTMRNTASFP